LNCFSVSVYCFKLGRLTVPPVSPRFLCRGVSFVDWFGLSVWESGFGEGSTGRLDLGCLGLRVGVGCPKESSEPDEDSTRWGVDKDTKAEAEWRRARGRGSKNEPRRAKTRRESDRARPRRNIYPEARTKTARIQGGDMEAWGGKNKNKRQMSISEE
jgi:hypothetical protein